MAQYADAMEVDRSSSELSESSDEQEADFEQFDEESDPEDHDEEASEEEDDDDEDEAEKDGTEEELERLVFGDTVGFKQEIKSWKTGGKRDTAQQDPSLMAVDDTELFFLDSGPDQALAPAPHDHDLTQRAPPAWEDSDDDRMMVSLMSVPRLRKLRKYDGEDVISGREYQRRLRQQFELLNPRPKWAQKAVPSNPRKRRRSSSAEYDSDAPDEDLSTQPLAKLLRNSTSLTRLPQHTSNKRPKLRPEVIPIERMKDISPTQSSAITSISVHPTMPLVLSAGPSSTLYLHHLQPHPTPPDPANPLITSLHLKSSALSTTAFSPPNKSSPKNMPQIYLSSRRRYFHVWDLTSGQIKKITRIHGHSATQKSMEILKPSPCGRYIALLGSSKKHGGVVNILDAKTTLWIAQAALESGKGIADFSWWGDGQGLTVIGRGGEVAEYSMPVRKVVARWQDEGAVGVTTIAMGGTSRDKAPTKGHNTALGPDRYIAVGSTSGIVNIYERSELLSPSASLGTPSHPKPLKVLDHLTTPISNIAFSPCAQLLVISSRWKRDALRLVHLPSATVYRNWPTSKTPLGRISAVTLGEYEVNDGMKRIVLLTGNEQGHLRGWEIGDQ